MWKKRRALRFYFFKFENNSKDYTQVRGTRKANMTEKKQKIFESELGPLRGLKNEKKNADELLCTAAKAGNIAAMDEAYGMGAKDFDQALMIAAKAGNIAAMDEAYGMGAKDFDQALMIAAKAGNIAAMDEAYGMGAKNFDEALMIATKAGNIAAMDEAYGMGAKDFRPSADDRN